MNNRILGNVELKNAEIIFKGDNNIFICNEKLILENCKVRFTGSNSIIYIDKNDYPMSLNMRVGTDCVIYIGKNCYINRTSNLYATERKNIIIGNELLLSYDVCFRTADPHTIYDCETKRRINPSKSIVIGDRVWIGQGSLVLKGTYVGSGAIIGGHSVVASKTLSSNSIYAGNPVKQIKKGVFYGSPKSTHDYDEEDEFNSMIYNEEDADKYIYSFDEYTKSLKEVDNELLSIKDCDKKLKFIENVLVNNNKKNRFFQI